MNATALFFVPALLLVASCSATDSETVPTQTLSPDGATTTTEATTTTTEATTTTTIPDVNPLDYFEAIFNGNLDEAETLAALAAPGSSAELYGKHQVNVRLALRDAGQSGPEDTIVQDGDAIQICSSDDFGTETSCAEYTDFIVDEGLLYSFKVDDIVIDDRLGSEGSPTGALASEARALSSYRSAVSDTLFVTVQFSASSPINLDLFSASYLDPSGRQVQNAEAVGPFDTLREGATVITFVAFEQADPGGTLFVGVNTPDYSGSGEFAIGVPIATQD